MRTPWSLLALVALVALAALACGRGGAPGAASEELVVAAPGEPDSPGVGADLGIHPINANIYETLVRLTPDFQVAPLLATRWQLRPRNTWRLHLRQGVKMHDGTALTAGAVLWTMQRIARAGGGGMGIGESSVRIINDTTVDITPTHPNRRLIEQLARPDWGIMATGSDPAVRPVGTGPFLFVEYAKGDHLTVERFDDYWQEKARLRRLRFNFLPDANARVLALRAGDVHVAADLPRGAARAVRMLPDVAVATSPVGGYGALYVNVHGRPPYELGRSWAIRRAIGYAVDRTRLVEIAWRGTAEPTQTLEPAALLGRSAGLISGALFDPGRARRVLAGAGWTPGRDGIRVKAGRRLDLTFVVDSPDSDVDRSMGVVVQDQLRDVGLDVRIVEVSDSAAHQRRIRSGAGDLWAMTGAQDDADPCYLADLQFHGGTGRPRSTPPSAYARLFAPGPQFDRLIDACQAAVRADDAQRSAARAMRVLIDEATVVIPLAGTYRVWGLRRGVQGFVPHPSSLSQRWDRVSLAADGVSR
jgi:peptide/nickel transport system substrate-binding protein